MPTMKDLLDEYDRKSMETLRQELEDAEQAMGTEAAAQADARAQGPTTDRQESLRRFWIDWRHEKARAEVQFLRETLGSREGN